MIVETPQNTGSSTCKTIQLNFNRDIDSIRFRDGDLTYEQARGEEKFLDIDLEQSPTQKETDPLLSDTRNWGYIRH